MLPRFRLLFDFSLPPKATILVFHREGSDHLAKMILRDLPFSVFDPSERLSLAPQILRRFVRWIGKAEWAYLLRVPNPVRRFFAELRHVLLLLHLDYIQPRVILTFVDNSALFHRLNRSFPHAAFIAIQNGARTDWCASRSLPPPPHPNAVIYLEHYFCFGQNEIDLFNKYGHRIEHSYPVGSLIGGYYRTRVASPPTSTAFDICLVSQWHEHMFSGEMVSADLAKIGEGLKLIDQFLRRYVEERRYTLVIAPRSNSQPELEYFHQAYGSNAHVNRADQENFATYRAMDSSRVVISLSSTAAFEAMAWGKPVLFCNFTGISSYSMPTEGIWSIREPKFEAFSQKLDHLLSLSASQFARETQEFARYVMNYDFSNPPHAAIRRKLLELVEM